MPRSTGLTRHDVAEVGIRRPGGRTRRNREALLDATLASLAEAGYERLSLEAVALRAGVHKTTVYRRWSTKERLVADALQTAAEDAIEVPDTGDVEQDLRQLAHAVVATLTDERGAGTVRALTEASQHSVVVRDLVAAFWDRRYDRAGTIVERAVRHGQLPSGTDPRAVIRHLGAPLYHQLLVTHEPLTGASADLAAAATTAAARAGVFVVQPSG